MSRFEKIAFIVMLLIIAFSAYKLVRGQETLPLTKTPGLPTYEHRLITHVRNIYKPLTLKVLSEHLQRHRNCKITQKIIPVLSVTEFYVYKSNDGIRAFSVPNNNVDWSKVFINAYQNPKDYFDRVVYSDQSAVSTLIHESIHNAYICGPDRYKTDKPICSLWANPIYQSADITRAIDEHFKPELSQLSTEVFQ